MGHRIGHSNPHWKAVYSLTEVPDVKGTGLVNIPSRALNIVWGNDSRYWQWISLSDEVSEAEKKRVGFEEGALLQQVNWIEVTGKLNLSVLKMAKPNNCKIFYLIKFNVDAFGWHSTEIKFKIRFNGEEKVHSENLQPYREKPDVWHEIFGGEFKVTENINDGSSVEFGMFEVKTDWWKGGMVLGGVKIK